MKVARSMVWGSVVAVLSGCGPAVAPPPAPPTPPVVVVEVPKLAVTAPGMPLGVAVEKSIGSAGGQLLSGDGRLTIEVPADAVAAPVTLTVLEISSGCPGALGVAYRLGPEGTTFAKPVKLTFKYSQADLAGTEAVALRVAHQDSEGRWNTHQRFTLDEAARALSVETTHFSDWAFYSGWRLSPQSALARANSFTAMQVKVCTAPDPGSEELTALIYTCAPDPDFFTVQEWAVNGVRGGTATTGTVAGSQMNGTAQFLAPGQAPPSNPVAVSASVIERSGRKTLLVSNIWIDDHPPLAGTIASLQVNPSSPQDFYVTRARVAFAWDLQNGQYEATGGTFFARHDQINPGGAACEIHTTVEGAIGIQDGTIIVQDNTYYPYGRTSALYAGTSTCNGTGTKPITIMDSAIWWPAPQMGNLTPKQDGSLEEQLTGILTYGLKVNVVWTLAPGVLQ